MDLKSRVDILEHDLSSKEDELRKLKGAMKAQEIQFSRLKDRVVRLTVDGAHGKEAFENNQTHGLQTHLTNTVVQDLLPSIYVDMSLLSIGGGDISAFGKHLISPTDTNNTAPRSFSP